jgi:hypothetical protein
MSALFYAKYLLAFIDRQAAIHMLYSCQGWAMITAINDASAMCEKRCYRQRNLANSGYLHAPS